MTQALNTIIVDALNDLKGKDIVSLDVRELSDVMDTLIIVSGTSSRHVKSLVDNVVEDAKTAGYRPMGQEGKEGGEWVLVDFGDTVVHAMLPQTREFYALEKLWSLEPVSRSEASAVDSDLDSDNRNGS